LVVPSGTLPNDTTLGVAVSPGITPVPLRRNFAWLFVALLVMLSDPVAAPATVGANFRATVMLAPTAKVFGIVSPVTLNSAPVTDPAEIVTLAAPVFVIVTIMLLLDSSPTFPILRSAGVKVRVPFAGVCAPAVAFPCMAIRSITAANAALAAGGILFL
jgi:hypothetical protein